MDHLEWLTGDNLFAKLEAKHVSANIGDLILAASQNEIPNTSEALDELIADLLKNGVRPGDFKKIRMYPKKTSDPDDKLENSYRCAESVYRRMVESARTIPSLPLSTTEHLKKDIHRIDYIKNPRLEQEFSMTKIRFRKSMINEEEMYMFHGTKDGNIDSILEENFRLDKAVGQAYGAGIYFSEFPCVSCSYGTLILCRVLPGRVETHYHGIAHHISYGFNSRRVAAGDRFDSSAIHVIKEVCQILPQYVITLKDISSQSATASTSYVPHYAFTAPALPPPSLYGAPASRYTPFVQNLGSTSTPGMAAGYSIPSTSTAQPTQSSVSTISASATSQSPQTKAAQRAKVAQERKNAKALAKATEKQQKALEEAKAKSAAKALADKQKADRLKLIEQEKADKLARLEQERAAKKALAEKEKADKQARLEQERAAKKALAEKERADRQAAKKALAAKAKAEAAAEKARKQVEAAAEVKASKEALASKAYLRAIRDRRSSEVLQSPTASRENKSSHLDDSVIDLSSP